MHSILLAIKSHGLQLCAVAAFPLIPLWLLALSGGLLLPSCLLCAVVEKCSSKMHSNLLAIKLHGLQLCAAAAFPLIPLWLLALSGGLPLLSCLLCAVEEKYSLKMCSNFLPLWLSGLQLCAVAAFVLVPVWLLALSSELRELLLLISSLHAVRQNYFKLKCTAIS